MRATAVLWIIKASLVTALPTAAAEDDRPRYCRDAEWAKDDARVYDRVVTFGVNHTELVGADVPVTLCVLDSTGKKVFERKQSLEPRQRITIQATVPTDAVVLRIEARFAHLTSPGQESHTTGYDPFDLVRCQDPRQTYFGELYQNALGAGMSFQGLSECRPRDAPPALAPTFRPMAGRVTSAPNADRPDAVAAAVGSLGFLALLLLIWKWIVSTGFGFGLFTRLTRSKLLDQRVRAEIHALVEAEPGLRLQDVGARLGIAQGTLRHHVGVLVRNGLIREVHNGRSRHLFTPEGPAPSERAGLVALRTPSTRKVYEAIQATPGRTLTELAAQAGVTLSTASRSAGQLARTGLVRREHGGRISNWFPDGPPTSRRSQRPPSA